MTIRDLVVEQAGKAPGAIAVGAPGREPLTYEGLLDQMDSVHRSLRQAGIAQDGRVAGVVPNGPESAVLFASVAASAVFAPLNPAYNEAEFEFYLADLGVNALVLPRGSGSASRHAATRMGVPILDLDMAASAPAGVFDLAAAGSAGGAGSGHLRSFPAPGDLALILHTSGTTARPKIVPLSHENLLNSARNIAATLDLGGQDRCLNVMPLFHIHGLVGAVLSSLRAGGSVFCAPGFDPLEMFRWIESVRPTWYTAVPTIHQAVLREAASHAAVIRSHPLRFIRSSSASLPPTVMRGLEEAFSVPVIESYGMTEASHQMASNPLPPRPRKPGSVGIAAGVEIRVLSGDGDPVRTGERGEVVVRGGGVTAGYEANPEANLSAFIDGFFRTGDQGFLDEDGYLFLTGRLKEIINRAGEKISPREVDEALLQHPEVVQAVTFAVRHPSLGEDVAAAVILRAGSDLSGPRLREFLAGRLAAFKVPQQVLIVDSIPKGPSGKLQRIGLADHFAHLLAGSAVPPRNSLESEMARIWSEVLEIDRVGVTDNFFALGGDSLKATVILSKTSGLGIQPEIIFRYPTIREIVDAHLATRPDALKEEPAMPDARPPESPAADLLAIALWLAVLAILAVALVVLIRVLPGS